MKKWLPLVLILFGFDQTAFAGFQENQISVENNQKQTSVLDSVAENPINILNYEGVSESDSNISSSTVENKGNRANTKDYLGGIQLNQKSYPAGVNNDLPGDEKFLINENNRIEEFELGKGFTFKMPFWLIGISFLFVIYTIFISLRFLSIYFQEVSTKEQLEIISEDFESYKRNTIEKERKLMRDLIDAKNRISDLSQ